MYILATFNPLYSVSGFAVGMLVGLTGVGGGSLMTPLLVLLFGIHPATAVGTDLLYASITKVGGTCIHGLNKTVDWRITARLASGSVPAAGLAVVVLYCLHLTPEKSSVLHASVLGMALILTAITLISRQRILNIAATYIGELDPRRTTTLTVMAGALLGILVSLSSVGAGAIGITALLFLYPRLPTVKIVGSDIAHAVPLTLVAGIGHWLLGSVDWLLLNSLLIGSLPGVVVGSYLAAHIPSKVLRPVLAATLLVVGCKLAL
jgi:uncharacterized membrane protein YfcA